MKMPSFIIIGAAKAGTTALYHYLKQHPQLYMSPVKETNFFALESEKLDFYWPGAQEGINRDSISINEGYRNSWVTNIADYHAQFHQVSDEIAIGDVSPMYLYSLKAPERMRHYVSHVKLIVILRNPVERAYSNFLHCVRDGIEPLPNFARVVREEEIRIQNNWWWGFHYLNLGFYHAQLKRYFDTFDQSQIKVFLYEDLSANPISLLQEILQFISVDETFVPDMSIRYNVTGIPNNKTLHTLLIRPNLVRTAIKQFIPTGLRQHIRLSLVNRNLIKHQLEPDVRRQLAELYRGDIHKLQDLIHRDLSSWLR